MDLIYLQVDRNVRGNHVMMKSIPVLNAIRLFYCIPRSRRRQRDGHEAELLQYLHVANDDLYEDVKIIGEEIKDGFDGTVEMLELIVN